MQIKECLNLYPGVIALWWLVISPQVHPVSERRRVSGRSKPFDLLMEEHRKRRKMKKLNKLRAEAGLSQMTPPGLASPVR